MTELARHDVGHRKRNSKHLWWSTLLLGLLCLSSTGWTAPPSWPEASAFDAAVRRAGQQCRSVLGLAPWSAAQTLVVWVDAARVKQATERLLHCPGLDPLFAAQLRFAQGRRAVAEGNDAAGETLLAPLAFLRSWTVSAPIALGADRTLHQVDIQPIDAASCAPHGASEGQLPWRPIHARFDGWVPLDGWLWPRQDQYVLAVAWVFSPVSRPAALRLATDQALKVWCNGQAVHEQADFLRARLDQDQVGIALNAGWNAVVLAVAHLQSGPWGFFARLTAPDGTPLNGLQFHQDGQPPLRIPCPAGAQAAATVRIVPGPFDTARLQAQSLPKGIRNLALRRDLARLLSEFGRALPADIQVPVLLGASIDPRRFPDILLERSRCEPQETRKLADLYQILEVLPQQREARLRLAEHFAEHQQYLRAMQALEALKPEDDDVRGQLLRARVLSENHLPAEADQILDRLQRRHPDVPAIVRQRAQFLAQQGARRKALVLFGRLQALGVQDEDSLFWRFDLAASVGRQTEARSASDRLLALYPNVASYGIERARYAENMGDTQEAQATLERLGHRFSDNPEVLATVAESLHRLGQTAQALPLWQHASKRDPQNREVAARLARTDLAPRFFEEPYRIDPIRIAAQAPPLSTDPSAGSTAYEILADLTVVQVGSTGLAAHFVQRIVRFLQAPTAADESSFHIRYDPIRQRLEDVRVMLSGPDQGFQEISERREQALTADRFGLYYDERSVEIPLHPVRSGTMAVLQYRLTDTGQNPLGTNFGELAFLQGLQRNHSVRYVLLTPADRTFVHHVVVPQGSLPLTQQERQLGDWREWSLSLSAVAGIADEPWRPGDAEVAAYIHVSTFHSWPEVGRWYAGLADRQRRADASILQAVHQAIGDLHAPRRKAAALFHLVTRRIRYVGLEFGVHSIQPYPAADVFERRFGDCKDMANLLVTLLQQAGIAANLVLVRTRPLGRLIAQPASLAAFDHAIVNVPELDLWLDPTSRYSGIDDLPAEDQGATALVVDGADSRLVQIPVAKPEHNRILRQSTWWVEADGAARFELRERRTGTVATLLRSQLRRAAERRDLLERQINACLPSTQVESLNVGTLGRPDLPLSFSLRGRVGQLAGGPPAGLSLPVAPFFEKVASRWTAASTRTLPWVLPTAYSQEETTEYHLPSSAAIVELPQAVAWTTPQGHFRQTIRQQAGVVTVTNTISLSPDAVAAHQYPELRRFLLRIDEALAGKIRLVVPPSAARVLAPETNMAVNAAPWPSHNSASELQP